VNAVKMTLVPDTSVLIDGRITRLVKQEKYKESLVLIPEAVVAELENQANKGRESGFKGLEELAALQELAEKDLIEVVYTGRRPRVSEFHDNDDTIRNVARDANAILVTSDRIQARVARAKGIEVLYLKKRRVKRELKILRYFDDDTMSVHLKDGVVPMAKRGKPGSIQLVRLGGKPLREREIHQLSKEIIEHARLDPDSFIEIERMGATVVQLKQLRIAIARPPFSDGYEITAVRPIADVHLEDYQLSEKLLERLRDRAEGILVAGPPGAGKSTFSQALAEFYRKQGKIVKTMESPRDLIVSDEITQYAPLEGDMEKTADILLLVRPDYTIYDEVRKTRDFEIFADMRLAGVGMVGVVHAQRAIDAIQRLIGRVELGMIPQTADTVIFIKDGEIQKVYKVHFTVKVPSGMTEADLARPVIQVKDFGTDAPEYEIYSFGDETIVMPVRLEGREMTPLERLAGERVLQEAQRYAPRARMEVEMRDSGAVLWVEDRYVASIIGKQGKNVERLERALGLGIHIRSLEERGEGGRGGGEGRRAGGKRFPIEVQETDRYLTLKIGQKFSKKMVKIYAGEEPLFQATASRKGEIKVGKESPIGEILLETIEERGQIFASLEE
jgi:ATPase